MNIEEIISSVQKALGITVDGKAGPETWEAIYKRIVRKKAIPKAKLALTKKVDDRSEQAIATLLPEVQPYARALVLKAAGTGITIKVISALRTYEEQNDLYEQGRSKARQDRYKRSQRLFQPQLRYRLRHRRLGGRQLS